MQKPTWQTRIRGAAIVEFNSFCIFHPPPTIPIIRRCSFETSTTCGHNFVNSVNTIKMKTAILASLIATAAAFAPAKQASTSTTLKAFEDELGAQPPLGFFDPLGMVADGDQEKFDRLRYVEIKHGRICMLGVVGFLINKAGVYLPGDIDYSGTKFSDCGSGWEVFNLVPSAGIAQVVAFIGFLELAVMKDITGGEFVGDFRNDAFDLGWDTFDEETKLTKRAVELNQGRAAQMGLLGLMVHDQLGNVDDFFP